MKIMIMIITYYMIQYNDIVYYTIVWHITVV